MKKRILTVILSVFLILSVLPSAAFAAVEPAREVSGTCGPDAEWEYDEDSCELVITGGGEIDDYQSGKKTPWSGVRNSIETVLIDSGITRIGSNAFNGCGSLMSVELPDTLISIGNNAFSGCAYLEDVSLPDTLETIGSSAFSGCESLMSVDLPESIISVGSSAFSGCSYVDSVTIPGELVNISTSMFENCTSLTELEIPDGIKTIGESAFSGCSAIETVSIPHSVKSIGTSAFSGCNSISEVSYDGTEAAWLAITIGTGNSSLTSAEIVYSDEEYDEVITGSCGPNAEWELDTADGALTVAGTGDMTNYHNGSFPWNAYLDRITSVTVGEGITSVANLAFHDCTALESVIIANSVDTIGTGAFRNCTALAGFTPGTGIRTIGESAFYGCTALGSFEVTAGVYSVNADTFFGCEALAEVTIPVSVRVIAAGAFDGCTALSEVNYAGSNIQWKNISVDPTGNEAFIQAEKNFATIEEEDVLSGECGDDAVWSFNEESGVLTISGTGDMTAFENGGNPWDMYLTSITSINVEEGITGICELAFHDCFFVTNVNIPESLLTVGSSAFIGCDSIAVVNYGGSPSEWNGIDISATGNAPLTGAKIVCAKEDVVVNEIAIEKISGYDVKLTGLDPALGYVIRYATGAYSDAGAVKKGANAGFVQVSGVSEATIDLPTHGLHTVSATVGSEQKFIGTVTIGQADIENQFKASSIDNIVKVENLYGARQIRLIQSGAVVMKIASFTSNGLKTWAEFTAPAGSYTVTVIYTDGAEISGSITVTVPEASISTNGRIFTLTGYGANNVQYLRFAKGTITTAAEMKSAPDLRAFARKYFTGDTAAFAALDAVNGTGTVYTAEIRYASGYSELITFTINPTVPVVTASAGTITLANVQTESYYLEWVRCAPGVQTTLYGIRHANGSQIRKTEDITSGIVAFTGLASGTYTLYYLYDGWNLSEGLVTVSVG